MKQKFGKYDSERKLYFMGYGKSYTNGEWWANEEQYLKRLQKNREYCRSRYANNKEKYSAMNKKWQQSEQGKKWQLQYDKNRLPKKLNRQSEIYHSDSDYKQKRLASNKAWRNSPSGIEWSKKYSVSEKKKTTRNKRTRQRLSEDILFLLKKRVGSRVTKVWQDGSIKQSRTLFKYCGCSPEYLRDFIQFQLGCVMSIESLKSIHIDHFFPISLTTNQSDLLVYSHFSNLRPMLASENMRKGSKIPDVNEICARNEMLDQWFKHTNMGGVSTQNMGE
jgi:hypothetical protein